MIAGGDFVGWLMLLDALHVASSLEPLRVLCAVKLHSLTGDRKGYWAMTVNERWRITFRFTDGDAQRVAIEDYHRG